MNLTIVDFVILKALKRRAPWPHFDLIFSVNFRRGSRRPKYATGTTHTVEFAQQKEASRFEKHGIHCAAAAAAEMRLQNSR